MFAPNALQRDTIGWAVGSEPYCFLAGEQGGGKTLAMALALIAIATLEPARYAWAMPTIKMASSSARPMLLDAAAEWGASASTKGGSVFVGGSEIVFFGDADVRSPDRLRSFNFAGAAVDEATLIAEPTLEAIASRVRVGSSRMLFSTNADNPYHPFLVRWQGSEEHPDPFDAKPGPRLFGTMADNPAISPERRAELERTLTGARYRRWLLGEWCAEVGLVWPDLVEVEGEDAEYLDVIGGADWGSANPSAAVFLGRGVSSGRWRIIGEWRYGGGGATSSDISDALAAACGRYRCARFFVDPSARDLILQLRLRSVPVAAADNDLLEGCYAVGSAARTGALAVLRGAAPALMREVRTFSWDPKAAAKGVDLPDKDSAAGGHSCDALRYSAYPLFGKPSLRPRPNPWR